MPVIGVLALQGDVPEHLAALERQHVKAVPVRRVEELDAVDALVIPGGESTAISKLLVAFDLLEPIRERLTRGMPALGSCAGMIMLASRVLDGRDDQQSLGALDITVRRNAFGRQVDSFETDVVLDGIDGGPFRTVFIRAPWVEDTGDDVEVIGRVSGGAADGKIVAVRAGTVMATAFHPEVTGDDRIHSAFVDLVRAATATAAEKQKEDR
ncbi:pyridoxal 5'-phosphate synthase glutaminase subunit PdxT [Stackebrandtia nassauensis]|uniref:Pyridoxal 5'-phosphate synthase subunit PdxT n=1 Tax=Stackebrandtia nassauensis (strain DSM 44728 / CIP 108903 / NRRL B-16338 / NBRC 102104 / LLR-40K-21) TaxID=446470 RepID=D3Q6D1_STANL|nr:pyridoxal 5'-phosphate synthase glutaminase subunit PdxT [Stackebrandtia nassauensis]ADD42306.1 SNO glutamine amidotransferase [Stackebrandtia nassauensis DSM 44728]